MGCCTSGPRARLTRTKGGSMIMIRDKKQRDDDHYDASEDIFSSKQNTYKMGDRIVRPVEIKKSFPVNIPKREGTMYLNCGYKSLRGRSAAPPHKPNQDSLSVFQLGDRKEVAMFSVFDGHGPFGEYASHFCRSELHSAFAAAPSLKYDVKKAMEEALNTCHTKFIKVSPSSTRVDPLVSGTTCISVGFEGNRMYCANVGDSRAILGSKNKDGVFVTELSSDHKPQRPDEKARIKKSNAILMTERDVRGLDGQNPTDKVYICREKNGDIVYGVLFTRSLGDKDAHEHLGVSEKPEFLERDIGEDDKYIILASDGVWDHMSNEEVVKTCFKKEDPLLACEQIVRTAAERWENQDYDHRRDDITVMVLKVEESEVKESDVEVET